MLDHVLDRMRDVKQRAAVGAHRVDSGETLGLEGDVADRQRLVDHQKVGHERGRYREGHAHLHAARVDPCRLVEIFADLSEGFDTRQRLIDLLLRKSHQSKRMRSILTSCELRIEAHAEFEDRRDPTVDPHRALRRPQRPGDHLEERALAGPVAADEPDGLAARDRERDVAHHPVSFDGSDGGPEPRRDTQPFAAIAKECLAKPMDLEHRRGHSTSGISGLALRNNVKASPSSAAMKTTTGSSTFQSGARANRNTSW